MTWWKNNTAKQSNGSRANPLSEKKPIPKPAKEAGKTYFETNMKDFQTVLKVNEQYRDETRAGACRFVPVGFFACGYCNEDIRECLCTDSQYTLNARINLIASYYGK